MRKQWILLILLLIFISTVNWIWLTIDTRVCHGNRYDHMQKSLRYARRLQKGDLLGFFKDLVSLRKGRPPLVMLLTTPAHFFHYRNEDLTAMANVLFIALTFLIIFKICKFYLDPNSAILCCFILFMYPGVSFFIRVYPLPIALMSMVSLSIYFLLRCEYFTNLKYSILLGISLGLGMLTKQSYPLFIAAPFIYTVLKSGLIPLIHKAKVNSPSSLSKVRLNFLYCLIGALALTSIWYIPNFKERIWPIYYNNSQEWARSRWSSHYYLHNVKDFLLFYPVTMIKRGTSFFFALLFLFSSIIFLKIPKFRNVKDVLIWWMIFPFLVFSCFLNKQLRYIIPLFPALAIMTGQGIYQIKTRLIRQVLIGLIVAVGLFQFFLSSFDIPMLSGISPKRLTRGRIRLFVAGKTYRPGKEEFMVNDIITAAREAMEKAGDTRTKVNFLCIHKNWSRSPVNYYAFKEKLNIKFRVPGQWRTYLSMLARKDYDYVMYSDTSEDANAKRKRIMDEALSYIKERPDEYRVIYEKTLRDGSNIVIYKR